METLRFRVLGFPTEVQSGFFVLAGIYFLFGLSGARPLWTTALFIGIIFVSILTHELGHAVVIRRLGLRVGRIALHGFGGDVTHPPTDPKRQLAISLAGPGAGLMLGAAVFVLSWVIPPSAVSSEFVRQMLFVNVIWSIFNLLPLYPLDGGNALASVLSLALGVRRAWPITHVVSMVLAVLLGLWGLLNNEIFILFIAGFVGWHNYQHYQLLRATSRWR